MDIARILHNKLGTSNDSWIAPSSICSLLSKSVLKNIKECFADLQTQVKMKLLLAFFHIPRRYVDEWKTELEEIIEVAALDSELWVSMTAETMKTFPTTGSLNTEISDYEDTRPIFTDMVNDLKKLVNKHHDIGMLPLECQYLNKSALVSVVGQQPSPAKHFTLKRNKPKSQALRTELLQKSADAQSSLKKASAPTVPLRSRGMPRKMADTAPMRGIPSRLPTSGFRSPQPSSAPKPLSRTPAGKKEGGVKLLDITEQPLGYAAAKKRKRQQELEEQQRKALEAQTQATTPETPTTKASQPTSTTPDYAAGLTASTVYSQPPTPMPSTSAANKVQIVQNVQVQAAVQQQQQVSLPPNKAEAAVPVQQVVQQIQNPPTMQEPITTAATAPVTIVTQQSLPSNIQIVRSYQPAPAQIAQQIQQQQQTQVHVQASGPPPPSVEIVRKTIPAVQSSQQQQQSPPKFSKILGQSNIILTQKPVTVQQQQQHQQQQSQPITSYTIVKQPMGGSQMRVVQVSSPMGQTVSMPTLTTALPRSTQIIQQQPQTPTGPKIVQIKTAPTIHSNSIHHMQLAAQTQNKSNIPPLIPTQQTILTQHPQQNPQIITTSQGHPKQYQQIVMAAAPNVQTASNVKPKTIILANPNLLQGQKNVLLRSGNTVYQLNSVQGLNNLNLGAGTTLVTSGPPQLVKTTDQGQQQQQQHQIVQQQQQQQMPALVPTNQQSIPSLTPVMFTQTTQQKSIPTLITNIHQPTQHHHQANHVNMMPQMTTIIRPVGGVNVVPQQLTLTNQSPQQIGRTIITTQAPQQQQQKPQQTIHIQKIPQQTTIQVQQVQQAQPVQQQQQQQQHATTRRGLSLSNKHVMEAHDMFKRANRVTRLDKALILGFMAGYRDNPRPNAENVLEIKLNESEENVKQADDTCMPMLVETLIRLDYNTGEWKTFRKFSKLGQSHEQAMAQGVTAS